MTTPKPGDTVDPRTLPVGAVFRFANSLGPNPIHWEVTEIGRCVMQCSRGPSGPTIDAPAILLSLPPTPQPECACRFDSGFNHTCDACKAKGKRPPCDACGEESHPSYGLDGRKDTPLCEPCANSGIGAGKEALRERVRARRAKQTSHSGLVTTSNQLPEWYRNQEQTFAREYRAEFLPPPDLRWQTTDPARIAALEGKLAEQAAHGGQDCKSARWLLERADTLRREEEARRQPFTRRDLAESLLSLQPGPRLMRHELPSDQRLDRKRTGR